MEIIFFSADLEIVQEWTSNHNIEYYSTYSDILSLVSAIKKTKEYIIVVDYDSISTQLNRLITADSIPDNTIVLERTPEITTGKMLISHGVRAYGNAKMLTIHFNQMIQAVLESKIWTYPKLTAALAKDTADTKLSDEALELIQNRLTPKEIEVIYHILDGLTNDAVAKKLDVTMRTVKAHITSIFNKLHVNDRISLVLLLK
jgi:DNA-binding NarL/FixJ family response regulator